MHLGKPVPPVRYRWSDAGIPRVDPSSHRLDVGTVGPDPSLDLGASGDVAVPGHEHVDVWGHSTDAIEAGQVVLDRVARLWIEQRDLDVRQHVGSEEHVADLDQECRMARGMCLVLKDPYLRTRPGDRGRRRWQRRDATQQLDRYAKRLVAGQGSHPVELGRGGLRTRRRPVAGDLAEPLVPEHMVPMRMGGEPGHDPQTQLPGIVGELIEIGAVHARIDQQQPFRSDDGNRVAQAEFALANEHAGGDLGQHRPSLSPAVLSEPFSRRALGRTPASDVGPRHFESPSSLLRPLIS